jgi:hypothetical protein
VNSGSLSKPPPSASRPPHRSRNLSIRQASTYAEPACPHCCPRNCPCQLAKPRSKQRQTHHRTGYPEGGGSLNRCMSRQVLEHAWLLSTGSAGHFPESSDREGNQRLRGHAGRSGDVQRSMQPLCTRSGVAVAFLLKAVSIEIVSKLPVHSLTKVTERHYAPRRLVDGRRDDRLFELTRDAVAQVGLPAAVCASAAFRLNPAACSIALPSLQLDVFAPDLLCLRARPRRDRPPLEGRSCATPTVAATRRTLLANWPDADLAVLPAHSAIGSAYCLPLKRRYQLLLNRDPHRLGRPARTVKRIDARVMVGHCHRPLKTLSNRHARRRIAAKGFEVFDRRRRIRGVPEIAASATGKSGASRHGILDIPIVSSIRERQSIARIGGHDQEQMPILNLRDDHIIDVERASVRHVISPPPRSRRGARPTTRHHMPHRLGRGENGAGLAGFAARGSNRAGLAGFA